MRGLDELGVNDRVWRRITVRRHLIAAGRLTDDLAAELRRQDEADEAERDRDYRRKMAALGLTIYGTPIRKRRRAAKKCEPAAEKCEPDRSR